MVQQCQQLSSFFITLPFADYYSKRSKSKWQQWQFLHTIQKSSQNLLYATKDIPSFSLSTYNSIIKNTTRLFMKQLQSTGNVFYMYPSTDRRLVGTAMNYLPDNTNQPSSLICNPFQLLINVLPVTQEFHTVSRLNGFNKNVNRLLKKMQWYFENSRRRQGYHPLNSVKCPLNVSPDW